MGTLSLTSSNETKKLIESSKRPLNNQYSTARWERERRYVTCVKLHNHLLFIKELSSPQVANNIKVFLFLSEKSLPDP